MVHGSESRDIRCPTWKLICDCNFPCEVSPYSVSDDESMNCEQREGSSDDPKVRFEFGENWQSYLRGISQERERGAEQSLTEMLGMNDLRGQRFLDVGCGSGLFSLSARRLGAEVYSFDYDEQSVACARYLKEKYFNGDPCWHIERGSVLDKDYMRGLGAYDIVYAWGVLHHTGDMWRAIDNVNGSVRPRGMLYLALYNDQGLLSKYWTFVKKIYNNHKIARPLLITLYTPYFVVIRYIVRLISGRRTLERGMSYWHDMIDWLGGFPFEVASREQISEYYTRRGYRILKIIGCGKRSGCNEFVMQKVDD